MDIVINYNPKILLQEAGAGWVWDVVFLIILIGLTLSFVSEVFKIQKKDKPDFIGVVWKTIFIVLMYTSLPGFLTKYMPALITTSSTTELDSSFKRTFDILKGDLGSIPQDPDSPDPAVSSGRRKQVNYGPKCPPPAKIGLMSFDSGALTNLFWVFLSKGLLFLCLVVTWAVKEVIFTWAWPTLMSINMIGLCAALAIPAFPRQGFGSIGAFFKSVATLALWPVMYRVFMEIVGKSLAISFQNLERALSCPTVFSFGHEVVLAFSGAIFMAFGIKMIPKLAESVMSHKGLGQVAAGAAIAAGIAMAAAGRSAGRAMSSPKSGGGGSSGSSKGAGGSSDGGFNPPSPKGHPLSGGQRGYSLNQAQDLVSQVAQQSPEKGKELSGKLNQAQHFNSNRGHQANQAMKNQAFNSVANDAIDFLKEQGGDKK
jgi:uncharacterized membrane protein YgcG